MSKNVSLNKNKNFKYIYNRGKNVVSPILVTYIVKNKLGINRIGITTSKKIGNAVERNRARRIIKVAYRNWCTQIKTGYDLVFVARNKTVKSNSNQIYNVMKQHLSQLNIWCLK